MRNSLLFILALCITGYVQAQVPEDALRMTWLQQTGTARNQAIGGAMGSLGGDITSTFVNPAGLAFYKTSEVVLSPGYNFLKNKSDFRETSTSNSKNSFQLGTSGAVFGFSNRYSSWNSGAFSIAVNRTANFNSNILYKGTNNYSSYSEQYAEELASSGIRLENVLSSNNLSIGTRMAYYTYLIDTLTKNGSTQIVGAPENVASRLQQNMIQTKGGITEIAIGLGESRNDKFYLGGSIGLPIVNYERRTSFRESDATGDTKNGFDYSVLQETYTTKGIGLNAKFGMIYKPVHSIRIGLAVHTPNLYGLKDTYSSNMTTAVENANAKPDTFSVASTSSVIQGGIPTYNYNLISPWKVLLSGSYVFGEVEDVTKQKGFISADVEYINYKGSSYQNADQNSDNSYYDGINNSIDALYKGSINVRVGGELKFNTLMARGGFSYYGSPYADSQLKAKRMFVSGGLGYRDKGFFIDLTYVQGLLKDVNFPYRLADKANTFANVKGTNGTALLTVGTKF